MGDSNCNCCCGCQYSTPPWWVTMGFVPPYNQQTPGTTVVSAPGNVVPGQTTVAPPAVTTKPGTAKPGGLIGGVAGGFANAASDVAGGIAGAVGSVTGGVANAVGEVADGFGKLLGGIL